MDRRPLSHYELLEQLGAGGMGVVYKARDLRLDRLVAIKVLPPEFASDTDRRMRFAREARSASGLNHPGIITVHEIDFEGDEPFIVMEYVEGNALSLILRERRLSIPEVVGCAIQISDALAAAHRAGIIHRDLKPDNIMMTRDGRVKVVDFGLAKLWKSSLGEDASTQPMDCVTGEGKIFGTVAYMSPEQAQGKMLDARSDLFSFGAILYEMVTGRRAFSGSTPISTLAAILNQDPRPATEIAPDIPPELDRIIRRCLRKDPARRFQDMDDLKVALEEVNEELDAGGVSAAPGRQRRWLIPVLLMLIVVAALTAGWLAFRPRAVPAPATVPLTSYSGFERHPSFAPDGNQVAFSWNGEKQDNYDIYVILASGGPPSRLTTDPAEDSAPAWSPDGRHIAFIRNPGLNGAVYVISSLGGPEVKVADTPGHSVCWSRDGLSLGIPRRDAGKQSIHMP